MACCHLPGVVGSAAEKALSGMHVEGGRASGSHQGVASGFRQVNDDSDFAI